MIKLKDLVKNLKFQQIKGSKDVLVTGISANSKQVASGNIFIAKKGITTHGAKYIPEAIAAGAIAIVTDKFNPTLKSVAQIIDEDVVRLEADIVSKFYKHPSEQLLMIGITGTNGKTTTAFLIKFLLDEFRGPCGLMGTIECNTGRNRYKAPLTTDDIIYNHKMLQEMVSNGCKSAVMEVTSHALEQRRVETIEYDIAIFSNLSLDHLDYHQTMEQYASAKNKLFRNLGKHHIKPNPKIAILNVDSPWTPKIYEGCKASTITFGIDHPADLRAFDIKLGRHGTELKILYQNKKYDCKWALIGRFNIYNCLSAMCVALSQGISIEEIIKKMEKAPSVRGRLEPVSNEKDLKIYVDFAHSDDALKNVLETLTELKSGKIITIFGCGGDRDRTKRPKMAEVAEKYSDFTIVTTDNPRSEDPATICNAIIGGFKKKDSYCVELDRKKAIEKAIKMASKEDIILIAGKGHETTQIFSNKTIEFDDCKIAQELCGTSMTQKN